MDPDLQSVERVGPSGSNENISETAKSSGRALTWENNPGGFVSIGLRPVMHMP